MIINLEKLRIETKIFLVLTMFCVKDSSKDNLVSESIASGDGWEWESVSKIMEAMSLHPEAVFIGM